MPNDEQKFAARALMQDLTRKKHRSSHASEFADNFVSIVGGPRALAQLAFDEMAALKPGSLIRARILESVLRNWQWASTRLDATRPTDGLSEEDLQREMLRVMDEGFGGAAMPNKLPDENDPPPRYMQPPPPMRAPAPLPPQEPDPPSGTVQASLTAWRATELRRLAGELARRRAEALKLYEPLPVQAAFHASLAAERVARGSNRSGKTLMAAVEVARAVTGADPLSRYPTEDGRAYLVGKDGKHLGQVMYRKLFRAGAFWMLRDRHTKLWRAYRPWDPADVARQKERKPAPPLVPPRFVASIGWENKKEEQPNLIRLTNGWELSFYSSLGKPPQGSDIDLCLAGWSEVYDPVRNELRRIDTIDGPWHVESYNEATKRREVREAGRPFVKGFGEICRVTLSNGQALSTTRRHRVLAEDGRWLSVEEAFRQGVRLRGVSPVISPSDLDDDILAERWPEKYEKRGRFPRYSSGRAARQVGRLATYGDAAPTSGSDYAGECVLLVTCGVQGCEGRCLTCCRPCDGPLLPESGAVREWTPSRVGVLGSTRLRYTAGEPAGGRAGSPACLFSATSGVSVGRGRAAASRARHEALSSRACCRHPANGRFQGPSSLVPNTLPLRGRDRGLFYGSSYAPADEFTAVYITAVAPEKQAAIWDVSVPVTHNYVCGGVISHNCWFDEEIVDRSWYPETSARLLDRAGHFIWSATPQAGTEQLYDLHERAEGEPPGPGRKVEEFVVLLSSNPHVSEEQKAEFASKLSEEDRVVRVGGEFLVTSFRVFPEYSPAAHSVRWFEVPPAWTRYVSIDPGRQVCAALFAAVPPPGEGDAVYFYDELYLPNCDAEQFGQAMARKCAGQDFHAFVIDHHGARMTDTGSGRTVEDQYAEALRRHKVKSRATGHRFLRGCDDVAGGVEAFRALLVSRGGDAPRLRVLGDRLANFEWEIKRYRYQRQQGLVTDKPEARGRVHLMACARYLAALPPRHVAKKDAALRPSEALLALRAKQKRQRHKEGTPAVRLGPGGNKMQGKWS